MQFWDTSALLPLVVRQGATDALPEFVCCDRRLAEAAAAEGFSLVIGA